MRDSLLLHIVRRELKRLIMFNLIIMIIGSIILFLRIYTNLILKHKKEEHDKLSYFVFEIVIIVISIINGVFGISLSIFEKRKDRFTELNCKLVNLIHLILNIICSIFLSLFFFIEFIRWCGNLSNEDQMFNSVRLIVILFSLIIVLCQTACAIGNRVLAWSPKYRYSRFVLCFSSIILMAISIASIIFDKRIHHLQGIIVSTSVVPVWCYITLEMSSSYTFVCGMIGVCLTFIYERKDNELNQFRKGLRYFFNIFCTIGLVLVIIFTIIFLFYYIKYIDKSKLFNFDTLKRSSVLLSSIQCILLILNMKSLHSLIRLMPHDRNGLTVERIRLSEMSPAYVTHWARAIDTFNPIAEGMTGDAALQLMKAYENGQLENIECVVLRIGRMGRSIQICNNQWDDTEAIVLLTIIHNYDLMKASHFDNFWGKFLQRTLGSENCTKHFRPLLLRVGLIGYQWPFRTSIFFTTSDQDPLTRNVHLLETIIDWNEMQKSNIHCDLLLLPTLSIEFISKAIPIAGFFPLVLPPTHLLDLRPHRGKTWNEYMKTLKKGNRRPYIQQFLAKGGTIEEVHDLEPREIGEIVCKQFDNIARIRHKNKEPPTLIKPSIEFISSMGNSMSESYRSVVFLRFNNEVIASSVIYKFPHKLLTTDIQGLTHEKARPLKAYFVMLQWVIKEALDKKYDFVDFGPTTPGPKLDLGCTSLPLKVGGYAANPILAFGIQQAGNMVDNIHNKNQNQQQSTYNQKKKKNNESQIKTSSSSSTDNNNSSPQTSSNHIAFQKSSSKQKQLKNIEEIRSINIDQTNVQETLTVTTDNQTQSTVLSKKKTNNKEQLVIFVI